MSLASRYPDWKAPAEDGKTLIWPEPRQLLEQTRTNHRRLTSTDQIRIAGIPLNELRRAQRKAIGHTDDARALIATGHQTELIHPGVWVKHVLINSAARALGGSAYQFAVDTDGPKHLTLHWPVDSIPITDDPNITTAAWCGLLDGPSPIHIARVADHFLDSADDWKFKPVLPAIIDELRPQSRTPQKLSRLLVKAILELDHSLGLSHQAVLVSPMLLEAPYLAFVHHLMSDAANFAGVYNTALAEYRRVHKTKSPTRPMPDLFASPGSVEAPFWLDNLATGTRSRPSVFPTDDGFLLELLDGQEFHFRRRAAGFDAAANLAAWLGATNHRFAPRALTLMTFIRLLIADNFVHGIGGGRYDQVSDDLIQNYFKLEAPSFAVTTGTMFFPGAIDRERACVPCVLQEGHRLKHAVLGARKRELVEQIEKLPHGSSQRQALFSSLHRERKSRLTSDPSIARWEQKLRQTELRHDEDEILFDRELFYAIQSRERLLEMVDRYDAAFATT